MLNDLQDFEEKFDGIYYGKDELGNPNYPDETLMKDIKNWIIQDHKNLIKEILEMLPKEKKSYYGCITHRAINGIDCNVCKESVSKNNQQIMFNSCLEEIKEKLNNLLK